MPVDSQIIVVSETILDLKGAKTLEFTWFILKNQEVSRTQINQKEMAQFVRSFYSLWSV